VAEILAISMRMLGHGERAGLMNEEMSVVAIGEKGDLSCVTDNKRVSPLNTIADCPSLCQATKVCSSNLYQLVHSSHIECKRRMFASPMGERQKASQA
jgi:hypothetical protein